MAKHCRKRAVQEPEEEADSENDDFYDRTALGKSKKQASGKVDSQDPSSIVGRKVNIDILQTSQSYRPLLVQDVFSRPHLQDAMLRT